MFFVFPLKGKYQCFNENEKKESEIAGKSGRYTFKHVVIIGYLFHCCVCYCMTLSRDMDANLPTHFSGGKTLNTGCVVVNNPPEKSPNGGRGWGVVIKSKKQAWFNGLFWWFICQFRLNFVEWISICRLIIDFEVTSPKHYKVSLQYMCRPCSHFGDSTEKSLHVT